MIWRRYHEETKHTLEKLMRSRHVLDWDNMPDPFRHYDGVPVMDLPADPAPPEIPALRVLRGEHGETRAEDGAEFLSQLLYYSASISASKRVPSTGYRYALRVNPSSGNLHPTEFHFATRGLKSWPDGLYHYRPSSHMAEQRALGDLAAGLTRGDAPLVFVLASIAWREAWKYRNRAYRYCLHDMGHAWQCLSLAARALGCDACARGHFVDSEVSDACRLAPDEWPLLIVEVRGRGIPAGESSPPAEEWFSGEPNRLSNETVEYPPIGRIHAATCLAPGSPPIGQADPPENGRGELELPAPILTEAAFGEVVRRRRSALDFRGGDESISLRQLATLLDAASQPLDADFAQSRFVQLYLYVHRVRGLAPGVYRYWPGTRALELVRAGDERVVAAALSLSQDLAGNACVAFSMIGDLERATRAYGERGYRYVHFEAGAAGQRLYLAAEAMGFQSTGIGAFLDDEVHRYLDIQPDQGQVVYHFACGYAVVDERLVG